MVLVSNAVAFQGCVVIPFFVPTLVDVLHQKNCGCDVACMMEIVYIHNFMGVAMKEFEANKVFLVFGVLWFVHYRHWKIEWGEGNVFFLF